MKSWYSKEAFPRPSAHQLSEYRETGEYCKGQRQIDRYLKRHNRLFPWMRELIEDRNVWPEPMSGCWLWAGNLNPRGYPRMTWDGVPQLAHKVVYEQTFGVLDDGLVVTQKCGNRACVNPDHLVAGTRSEMLQERKKHAPPPAHAKLAGKVHMVKEKLAAGVPVKDVAQEMNVSSSTISQVLSGDSWRYVK